MNKTEIEERFSRASKTYSSVSSIQKEMAENLFSVVSPLLKNKNRVLEFGVGTGGLSRLLCNDERVTNLTMIDMSSGMLEECKKSTPCKKTEKTYIESDIEIFQFKKKNDLIISNATVQWLKDFEALIEKISKNLKSGSLFAFTSFGPQSLHELYGSYDATQETSLKRPVHLYSQDFLESALVSNSFKIIKSGQSQIKDWYPSVKDILKGLKQMGVTPKAQAGSGLTKSSMLSLEHYYREKYATDEGVPCTWENIWIVGEKI